MTKQQHFPTTKEEILTVSYRKSAVEFHILNIENIDPKDSAVINKRNMDRYKLNFEPNVFIELINYIKTVSDLAWKNLTPKEAYSLGSDYDEYHDRTYGNEGFLRFEENEFTLERPYGSTTKFYQFNKPKMESFLYDVDKKLNL